MSGRVIGIVIFALVMGLPSLHAQNSSHRIAAANIKVVQHDTSNTTNSVTVTTPLAINQFSIRAGSNRGDCNVQIGPGFSDDVNTGVLISCIAENGRDNAEATYSGVNYCTSAIDYARSGAFAGSYYIPMFNAPSGAEYNVNLAAAYFSYTNWLGGFARNSGDTTGGVNNLFTGSPGLILGVHFIDNGNGISTVDLRTRGIDSQTSGVLLVTHARNEDNFALSKVNTNGTWTVYVRDNGTDATSAGEQDPVAFVFVPKTNASVISGRFQGDGTALVFSGTTPRFSIVNTSTGTWRLTIPGYSPNTGVLILSAEGGVSANQDNIVSYKPDGNGWIIQSRDLTGATLQTPVDEPVASFVFIPAPAVATLVAPVNDSQTPWSAPALQVNISNTVPGNVTVNFYGRVAGRQPGPDFAIAALPDTQYYVSSLNGGLPGMFYAQTEWIITNRVSENIAYVAHLGDITQNGDVIGSNANTTEWRNATNAMYRLENPTRTLLQHGIPYGVAVGNHDQEPIGSATGTTTFYNQYFGTSRFAGRPYYGGHYGPNNDNHFDLFSAGGLDFVVLYFEYDTAANPNVLAWGNEVLRTNANRRAIVVTHNFGNTQTPLNFSAQGQAIYTALRTNSNLFLMLAGHVTGEGSRIDTFNGNVVRTYVSDYQGWTNGGNGFMRMMYFSPRNNQVVVQTYSPWIDQYETDANSEFFFGYNMQPPPETNAAPFVLVGTRSNVSSSASCIWNGRQYNTAYEWYVTVTDQFNNTTTSPVWRFSTATNSPPAVSSRLVTLTGDTATNLLLSASDPNGDALTFRTNTVPLKGLLSNFDTNTGAITYQPAHGFRGIDSFGFRASDGLANSANASVTLNVISPPDTNSNGIPDSWETAYGITSATADNDGDGHTNLQEYFANTNPTNAASFLSVGNTAGNGSTNMTLVWPSVGGTRYRVQYSNGGTNAHFNGAFGDIIRSVQAEMDPAPHGAPSTQSFVDDFTLTGSAATNNGRYYRIKIVQ